MSLSNFLGFIMKEFFEEYIVYWEDRMIKAGSLDPEQQRMVRFAYAIVKADFESFLEARISGNESQNLNS